MAQRGRVVFVCSLGLTVSLLVVRSGDACTVDRLPPVEERAREMAVVVVATVGDLADTTADEDGLFAGAGIRLRFIVRAVLKGTTIPDTLILSFWGVYSAFYPQGSRGWSLDVGCGQHANRGEVVVLFLEGVAGTQRLRYDNLFQLMHFEWNPNLLQSDIDLVRVQQALAGPPCSQDRLPPVEERAREAVVVVVATVGDLMDATADELGFFAGTAHVQFGVHAVLKGTAIPEILTLPVEGQYTTFVREGFRGWIPGVKCHPDISRGEVVVLFLDDGEGDRSLRSENIFHLGYGKGYQWNPGRLQEDEILVRVQHALGGSPCSPDRLPTVEERAREAVVVVVATVGKLVDATVDEQWFFDGTAHVQFGVHAVLKGTAVPEILILPFEGRYSTFFREGFWGWLVGSECQPDISGWAVVVLFLGGTESRLPLRYDNIFHLGYFSYGWDPSLLQREDIHNVLVRVQRALVEASNVEERGSWGSLKRRFW
jgi:hypothetical protein